MKKLLMVLAVGVALVSNAASVKWDSGNSNGGFVGPDGNKITENAYTMTVYFYSDSAGQTLISSSSDSSVSPSGAYSATDDYAFTADATYYAKAIISSSEYSRESVVEEFSTVAQGNTTLNFMSGSGFSTTGQKWGDWQEVPEPTSGMLLLLGMAGLALKRKRA